MANFITKARDAARKFTIVDFGIFKIYLVAVGVLLGAYFSAFFIEYICTVWIIAVLALIFILAKVLNYSCNHKRKRKEKKQKRDRA